MCDMQHIELDPNGENLGFKSAGTKEERKSSLKIPFSYFYFMITIIRQALNLDKSSVFCFGSNHLEKQSVGKVIVYKLCCMIQN